jgi:ParB-like chromosome segregation protein Spo0J
VSVISKGNVVLHELVVERVSIDRLRPNDYNPNRMADHEMALLKRSIQTNGFTRPVVARRGTGVIVDGYHRWKAQHELGAQEIDVVWVDMTDEQAKIATLRLNRAHGEEDSARAADVIRELAEMGALGMAREELQLDDVEMKRLLGDMGGDELASLGGFEVDPATLGSEQDRALGVDTSADVRRAREEMLKRAKAEEERSMTVVDDSAYKLVLIYTGEEAALVRRVLASLGSETSLPQAVLALCRRELEAVRTGGGAA